METQYQEPPTPRSRYSPQPGDSLLVRASAASEGDLPREIVSRYREHGGFLTAPIAHDGGARQQQRRMVRHCAPSRDNLSKGLPKRYKLARASQTHQPSQRDHPATPSRGHLPQVRHRNRQSPSLCHMATLMATYVAARTRLNRYGAGFVPALNPRGKGSLTSIFAGQSL